MRRMLRAQPLGEMPDLEISRLLVFVPARAPALRKAKPHCRAGAPAGLGTLTE